jgi:hypothetical protein
MIILPVVILQNTHLVIPNISSGKINKTTYRVVAYFLIHAKDRFQQELRTEYHEWLQDGSTKHVSHYQWYGNCGYNIKLLGLKWLSLNSSTRKGIKMYGS